MENEKPKTQKNCLDLNDFSELIKALKQTANYLNELGELNRTLDKLIEEIERVTK